MQKKLARYSYSHTSVGRSESHASDRHVHEAVLAAIGTPQESSLFDAESVATLDENATQREMDEASTRSVASSHTTQSEKSESSEATTSSTQRSTSSAASSSSAEDNESIDSMIDGILGKQEETAEVAAAQSPTNGSQIELHHHQRQPPESLQHLSEILESKRRRNSFTSFDANTESAEDSPGVMLNKLLFGEKSPPSGEGSFARRRAGSLVGSKNSTPPDSSSRQPLSSSLTMIGQLHAAATVSAARSGADHDTLSVTQHLQLTSPNGTESELNFKRGKEIGKGGFGVVFQAVLEDGRLAAVKQLPAADRKGIGKEMRVMMNLPPHPHCVQYLGWKRTPHHVYMVMEYVSGGSVHSLRRTVGRLPESLARRYIHMTLLGLAHLHSHKIIHQDIKGANVLLDEKGNAKIADFGCIKDLGSRSSAHNSASVESTQGGAGTPLWMAPEVCRGEYPSTKSDVWSLGCLFLEMVNESGFPWAFRQGTTLQGAAYAIGSATHPPPFPSFLSPVAVNFLNYCLAVHPTQRKTAVELLQHPFFAHRNYVDPALPTEADFYRTMQSVSSATASATTFRSPPVTRTTLASQNSFVLEAASDDDEELAHPTNVVNMRMAALKGASPPSEKRQTRKESQLSLRGEIVWKSAGAMRVAPAEKHGK